MIHHKVDKLNKGVGALSRRYLLLLVVDSKVLGLKIVKRLYVRDEDIKEIHANCANHAHGLSQIQEGLSFQRNLALHGQMWVEGTPHSGAP